MKRVSLAALATLALLGAAGCQDAVTSPQLGPDASLRYGPSNPPPPPVETRATGSFCCAAEQVVTQQSPGLGQTFSLQRSSGFRPRFSFQGSSLRGPALDVQPQQVCSFSIPVRYFFNNESRSGSVHFESSSDDGVMSSSNGMVKFAHDDFSGAGTLEILGTPSPCLIVIDLSTVNDESSNFDDFSFNLFFDEALLYECGNTSCTPIEGSADMSGFVVGEG